VLMEAQRHNRAVNEWEFGERRAERTGNSA
jgi:hypothetical protein